MVHLLTGTHDVAKQAQAPPTNYVGNRDAGCSASNLGIGDMLTIVDAQDTAQTPFIEGIQPAGRSLGHCPRFFTINKDGTMYVEYGRIFVAVVMLERQTFRSNAFMQSRAMAMRLSTSASLLPVQSTWLPRYTKEGTVSTALPLT